MLTTFIKRTWVQDEDQTAVLVAMEVSSNFFVKEEYMHLAVAVGWKVKPGKGGTAGRYGKAGRGGTGGRGGKSHSW